MAHYTGQGAGGLQAAGSLWNGCLFDFATAKYKGLNINNMVEEEYSLQRSVCIGDLEW